MNDIQKNTNRLTKTFNFMLAVDAAKQNKLVLAIVREYRLVDEMKKLLEENGVENATVMIFNDEALVHFDPATKKGLGGYEFHHVYLDVPTDWHIARLRSIYETNRRLFQAFVKAAPTPK